LRRFQLVGREKSLDESEAPVPDFIEVRVGHPHNLAL
jgi:hypothetical protein